MAQIVVRRIDDAAFERFKEKARRAGQSAEARLRELIRQDGLPEADSAWAEIDRIRAISAAYKDQGGRDAQSSTPMLRDLRDRGWRDHQDG
jgi:plasmid stability protein